MTSTPSPACCSLCEPLASFGPEEDDYMPSSLTPACSICGLRFTSRPLLELHIREDHLQPDRPAGSGHGDPAGGRASQPPADGPARGHRQLSGPPRITKEVTTMTGTRRPRRPLTGSVMAALRRVIRAVRDVHAELLLASETMFRPAGAPRPRPPAGGPAVPDAHAADRAQRASRAA